MGREAFRRRGACGIGVLDGIVKHLTVRGWLVRHPYWTFHFTRPRPRGSNAIEGFFAVLTKRHLKRGVLQSVADLQAAIERFLDEHNAQSKPFQWVADPDRITAAVRRGHQAFDPVAQMLREVCRASLLPARRCALVGTREEIRLGQRHPGYHAQIWQTSLASQPSFPLGGRTMGNQ